MNSKSRQQAAHTEGDTFSGPVSSISMEPARGRVLLCIDDSVLGFYLQQMLERAGYTVVGLAVDGPMSLALASARSPDLIVMDFEFADGESVPIVQEILRQTWRPILLLSDFPLQRDACGALPGGACDYLPKPFSRSDLLEAMVRLSIMIHWDNFGSS